MGCVRQLPQPPEKCCLLYTPIPNAPFLLYKFWSIPDCSNDQEQRSSHSECGSIELRVMMEMYCHGDGRCHRYKVKRGNFIKIVRYTIQQMFIETLHKFQNFPEALTPFPYKFLPPLVKRMGRGEGRWGAIWQTAVQVCKLGMDPF